MRIVIDFDEGIVKNYTFSKKHVDKIKSGATIHLQTIHPAHGEGMTIKLEENKCLKDEEKSTS